MINSVVLVGNLTRDVQYFKTQSGISYARFTVAVNRKVSEKEETSFISCIAWRQSADFLNQYSKKGDTVGVEGHITTGSYDDKTTGKKVYTTDITADRVQLLGKKSDNVYGQESLKHEEEKEEDFNTGPTLDINPNDLPF